MNNFFDRLGKKANELLNYIEKNESREEQKETEQSKEDDKENRI